MVASVEPTTPSAAPADRSAMQNYRNDRLCRGFGHSALDIIQLNLPLTGHPTRRRETTYSGGLSTFAHPGQ